MKTLEQKAEEYAEVAFAKALKAPWPEAKHGFAAAYIAGATEALASQWIELTPNSTPPINQDVLCLGETGDVAVLQMTYSHLKPMGYQLTWLPKVNCKITHWMPIPSLPKPESHA